MYQWMVFFHIVGVFIFLLGHGGSMFVALKLRNERSIERVRALLDLSTFSFGGMYIGLIALLTFGVVAGFQGHWWGRGWIWASIGLLVAMVVLMFPLGSMYYAKVRKAVGLPYYGMKKGTDLAEQVNLDEMASLLSSMRPYFLTAIGMGGLLGILWLMMFKPF